MEINSDHWYEVSETILSIKRGVVFSRHIFQNKAYYVISIETTNQHIKISTDTYVFLQMFNGVLNVSDVRDKFNAESESHFSQEACISVIKNLADKSFFQTNNHLEYDHINRNIDNLREEVTSMKWSNFLFFQQPLCSPNSFLKKTFPFVSLLFNWFAVAIYLLLFVASIWMLIPNLEKFNDDINGIISSNNIFWIFVVVIMSKVFHELAHGYTCIKYQKQVTTFGVMFLVFTPLPFVDVSSVWSLPSKFRRICVASAGMISDTLMGALALIIWTQTSDGLINSIAFNTIFITFISTLFFNLNPLVRFDGYHILSDLLEISNLQSKSQKVINYVWDRHVGGDRSVESPSNNSRELKICFLYGVLSFFYRIFLMLSIAYILSLKFLVLGKILAVFTVFYYMVKPAVASMRKTFSKRRNSYVIKRMRLIYISAWIVFLTLILIPLPHYFRSKGVISSAGKLHVYTEIGGHVRALPFSSGSRVKKGDTVLILENHEIENQLEQIANKIKAEVSKERLYASKPELLKLIKLEISSLENQYQSLEEIYSQRVIKSPSNGVISYSMELLREGGYVNSGEPAIKIRDDKNLYFSSVVNQKESIYAFQNKSKKPEIKIYGLEHITFSCGEMLSIPASSSQLPSASLGIMLGGEVTTQSQDPEGKKVLEEFFEMRGKIKEVDLYEDERLLQERRGEIRLYLGKKSLLARFYRWGKQLLQQDHRI